MRAQLLSLVRLFCDSRNCIPPGSSVHGISQASILEWVAISSSRGSLRPRDRTHVSCISCVGRWVLYHWATWEGVQSLSHVWLFATPWIAARQASLSITNSRSSLRLTSIESVMPSSHLILCRPFLLLSPIPPSIRIFSNESTLCMRWPKYWSFSFSIIPSKEHPGLIPLEWTGWISLQSKGLSRVFSNTTVQKHQFFGTQPSSQSNSHILGRPYLTKGHLIGCKLYLKQFDLNK